MSSPLCRYLKGPPNVRTKKREGVSFWASKTEFDCKYLKNGNSLTPLHVSQELTSAQWEFSDNAWHRAVVLREHSLYSQICCTFVNFFSIVSLEAL